MSGRYPQPFSRGKQRSLGSGHQIYHERHCLWNSEECWNILWRTVPHVCQRSLKGTAREKRGKRVRRQVLPAIAIPNNWKDFLRVDDNKTELFRFLAQQVTRITTKEGAAIYATLKGNVLCSVVNVDLTNLVPCSHEEADTRLLLHVVDAVKARCKKVSARTVDTDVVFLDIALLTI